MPSLPVSPSIDRAFRAFDLSSALPQEWAGAVSFEQLGLGMAASAVLAACRLATSHPARKERL